MSANWLDRLPDDYRPAARALSDALAAEIEIDAVLGVGGMGAVLAGHEKSLDRRVAVKLLSPALADDPVARERFLREAQAAAAVQHPHVVTVFRVGQAGASGHPFFVMQLVAGRSLDALYPDGREAPIPEMRRIVGQVASALAAAHAVGLVHRDIKPANVLVEESTGRVVVADFGISASRSARARDARLTQQGETLGTPRYMSPEAAAGEDVGPEADVYALGCIAFELLAGHPVFTAPNAAGVIARHIRDVPPPAFSLRPDLQPEVSTLVDRALAKEPAERPTADEMARTLLPEELPFAWPPPGLERLQGTMVRGGWGLTAATALMGTPMCVALGLGLDVPVLTSSPAVIAGVLLLVPTIVLLISTAMVAGFQFGMARRATRAGLPYVLALELLADPGDTGSLLASRRSYAALDDRRRRRLRIARVARGVLLFAPALLTQLLIVVVFVVGPVAGWPASVLMWGALLVLLGPLMAVIVLDAAFSPEHRRPSKKAGGFWTGMKADALLPVRPREIAAWREAAGPRVTDELQGRGAMPAARVVEYASTLALLPAVAVVIYLASSSIVFAITGSSNIEPQVRLLEATRALGRVPPALRPAPDTSLGPVEAGQIAYRLFRPSEPLLHMLPADSTPVAPSRGVRDTVGAFDGQFDGSDRWRRVYAIAAVRGFNPAQLALLHVLAEAPGEEEFRRLSHARTMDLYGVLLGDRATVRRVLFAWFPSRTSQLADAELALGAIALAAGRREEALDRVRNVLGVAALLMQDGRKLVDVRAGSRLARLSAGALESLGAVGIAPLDVAFATPLPLATDPFTRSRSWTREEELAYLQQLASDRAALPALRLAALSQANRQRCAGPFSGLFTSRAKMPGVASLEQSLTRVSDRSLVSYASDSLEAEFRANEGADDPGTESVRIVGIAVGTLGLSSRAKSCWRAMLAETF